MYVYKPLQHEHTSFRSIVRFPTSAHSISLVFFFFFFFPLFSFFLSFLSSVWICWMGTQSILLQALQALYHDPSPDTRNAANQWLQNFQHSLDAWQVSFFLLSSLSLSLPFPSSDMDGKITSVPYSPLSVYFELYIARIAKEMMIISRLSL